MAYGFKKSFGRGPRRFGGGNFGGPREMHKIKCSDCGKDAEVPFKPRGDSPVYCRECFFKRKGITPREGPREERKEKKEESEESEETSEENEEAEGEEF